MNKYKITIGFIVLLITIGVISGDITSINSDAQRFKFDSQEVALIDGINQNSNEEKRTKDPLENVILSTEYNKSLYVVVKVPFSEYEMDKDYAYVAAVREKNSKFCFEKVSPDISLNTLGDIKDVDFTPNATFYFDNIEGLYFAVGKIYDDNYRPYMHGEQIQLLNSNIYAVVQEQERPQIDVVKMN